MATYSRNTPTVSGAADVIGPPVDGKILAWNASLKRHEYVAQGTDPTVDLRISALEDRYVRVTRFTEISSGLSGTVTQDANYTIILDGFGAGVDAVVGAYESGTWSFSPVLDSSGNPVVTTFDVNGNYTLSSTPVSYPVALIYLAKVRTADYDESDTSNIMELTVELSHNEMAGLNVGDYKHLTAAQTAVTATIPYYLATASMAVTTDYEFIGVAGSGSVTLTLPELSTVPEGKVLEFKQLATGTSTLIRPYNNSDNIDSLTTDYNLSGQHDSLRIVAGTTQWRILTRYSPIPQTVASAASITHTTNEVVVVGSNSFTLTLPRTDFYVGNTLLITHTGTGTITLTAFSPAGDFFDGVLGSLTLEPGETILLKCRSSNQWARLTRYKHNDLTGLQGGTSSEYYHLTAAEIALLHPNDPYVRVNLSSTDSPYTITSFNKTIYSVSLTSGSVIVNLPAVDTAAEGKHCHIYVETESGTNTLTVNTNGAQTIQGRTSHVFRYKKEGFHLSAHNYGSPHWDVLTWQTDTSSGKASFSEGRAGFVEWYDSGDYWSIVGTTFTLLRGGRGFIRGNEVIWVSGQSVTLGTNEYSRMGIDRNGLLNKVTSWDVDANGSDYVSLFTVLRDPSGATIVTRADYGYDLDHGARVWLSRGFGAVVAPIQYGPATMSRYGVGSGGAAIDRQINLSAGGILDGDILETWNPVTTGQTISFAYANASGQNVLYVEQKEFPMFYNNAGTPTAISAGNYGIYRMYAVKSSLNDLPPQITAEMDNAQYLNSTAAQNAVNANTPAGLGTYNPDVAQLGLVIVHNSGGGYVFSITTAKKTLTQYSTGGSTGTAASINTSVANFDGVLSAADTTTQAALETIDDIAQRKDSVGLTINAATEKTTPVDADMLGLMDSAASNVLKKLSWSNIKATIKSTVMTWSAKQTFDGGAAILGSTTAVSAGYVGERIALTTRSVVASVTTWTVGSSLITFTEGVWLVFISADMTAASGFTHGVSVVSTNNTADFTGLGTFSVDTTSGIGCAGFILVTSIGAATLYPKLYCYGAGTTGTFTGYAIRIA